MIRLNGGNKPPSFDFRRLESADPLAQAAEDKRRLQDQNNSLQDALYEARQRAIRAENLLAAERQQAAAVFADLRATIEVGIMNEERLMEQAQQQTDNAGKLHARIAELLTENDNLFYQVEAYEDIAGSLRGRIALMSGPAAAEHRRDEMAVERECLV